jgi:hypothetical protein
MYLDFSRLWGHSDKTPVEILIFRIDGVTGRHLMNLLTR